MRLFGIGRKKEGEELAEDDGPELPEEDEAEPEKPGRKGKKSKETNLTAGVERLSAKLEVLSELRKADAERFSRISEQIGELRNLILEKEEDIKELGVKATKAAETVEELKPESIMAEARKSAAKYDVLEAKIEAGNALYQKLMEELKEARKKLSVFHGMEGLMKLNEETSSNLANIKRIEANIESRSNKVGNTYVQFQKQANELIKYRDTAAALADEFRSIKKSVDEVKARAQSALIDKTDLDNLGAGLRADFRKEFNKKIQALQGTGSEQPILDVIRETRQRLDEKDREAGKELTEVKKLKAEMEGASDNARNEIAQFQKQVSGIAKIESRVEELKSQLDAYAAQKKFSEQLVVDTLKEARERLARRDKDVKSLRAELSEFKERFYEAMWKGRQEQPHEKEKKAEEPSGTENEIADEFKSRLEKLRQAIQEKSTRTAIALYNEARESYIQAAEAGMPESEKYALTSQLLNLHRELRSLINTVTTPK